MPYIKPGERCELADGNRILTPGRLNYLMSMLAKRYWQEGPRNYQAVNDIMGAFDGAKAEFYRRVAAPYEDQKIKENGDIYE